MAVPRFMFMGLLPIAHGLTRSSKLVGLGRAAMRFFGWFALLIGGGKAKGQLPEVAEEWRRMFPLGEDLPITGVEGDTAYAQVRIRCPYRGSGNVRGCYRMMEYDRSILEALGGQLVILESQAEPGVEACKLAIRRAGAPVDDLEHAHERVERTA